MSDVTRTRPTAAVRRRVEVVARPLPRRVQELFLERVGLGWVMLVFAVLMAVAGFAGWWLGVRLG